MRFRRFITFAATACFGISVIATAPAAASAAAMPSPAASPLSASPVAPAQPAAPSQPTGPTQSTAPTLPGQTLPDYTPTDCNRVDLPAGVARCLSEISTPGHKAMAAQAGGPPATALGPADIRSAYNLPDGGDGQTVAIVVAYGYSAAEADLAIYRAHYNLPACTTANGCFRQVDQNGGTDFPADDAGWALEAALDVDAVSAACPRCNILMVNGDTPNVPDLGTGVETAVRLGAKFVSNSYGLPAEDPGELEYDHYYDHPGVMVAASSGDVGNVTGWPAASPDVLAVGGTKLEPDASTERGWVESAWVDGGSGCSPYEPRPDYQQPIETGCDNRAMADVSAVGDPDTGLGVYNSLYKQGGWFQVGGTSLSSPLLTGMAALAGPPVDGSYPVTYPYAAAGTAALNDVTQGTNGTCGDLLCQAGAGWDGPTGLGTPNGVGAFTFGPAGTVAGTISDQSSGAPIGGATIAATDHATGKTYRAGTGSQGKYQLAVPAGTYDLTVTGYGYASASKTGVTVAVGKTVSVDLVLHSVPSRTVTGTIRGDADHPWPLAASITIDGYPNGTISTDPQTGRYSVDLPVDADYRFHIAADYPGYLAQNVTVTVNALDSADADADLQVDRKSCIAPGYAYPNSTDFEGWHGTTPRDGWTVTGSTPGWEFTGQPANLTGGTGNFAGASPFSRDGAAEDTYLISPPLDLTGQDAPELRFHGTYVAAADGKTVADVEVSLDGGTTWTVAGHPTDGFAQQETFALPQAAGQSDVRLRLHYVGRGVTVWQIDDLTVGRCTALPGGLVAGTITDANTGKPVVGATVQESLPSSDNGAYAVFAGPGEAKLTTDADRYAASTGVVTVHADTVNRHDWKLNAGRLHVSTESVSIDAALGQTHRTKLRLTNTGGAPLHVAVGEHGTGGVPATGTGWTDIADYPLPVESNVAGSYRGKVYSVGGVTPGRVLSAGYVYDPATLAWAPIADLPEPRVHAMGTFLDGVLYVAGGWKEGDAPVTAVYAYHPTSDSWSRLADLPKPEQGAGVAVLDHQLYLIAGCRDTCTDAAQASYRYDPRTDTWVGIADYPEPASDLSCAGITGMIVCAGGHATGKDDDGHSYYALTHTYRYDPDRDSWTRLADMPYNSYLAAYSGANGKLQIAGGITDLATTARAAEFDPVAGTWHELPSQGRALAWSGSACGLYQIGGDTGGGVLNSAKLLPGYDSCGGDEVSWLSTDRSQIDLAPGASTLLTVTGDAGIVSAPGQFGAELSLDTDSPYAPAAIDVNMQVAAPKSWTAVSGTVTDADGSGIPGATVRICANDVRHCARSTYTVSTDADGRYEQWVRAPRIRVDVSKDGYQSQSRTMTISRHHDTTVNFSLQPK